MENSNQALAIRAKKFKAQSSSRFRVSEFQGFGDQGLKFKAQSSKLKFSFVNHVNRKLIFTLAH